MTAARRTLLRRVLLGALTSVAVWASAAALWSAATDRPLRVDTFADGEPLGAAHPASPLAAHLETAADLAGPWLVRLGDDPAWAAGPAGAGWDTLAVPGAWEDAGLWGYDGFAWLRTTFRAPRADGRPLLLHLGRVDDADEVFLNGQRVGATGGMPPAYATAADAPRAYWLPAEALRPGLNTLAVRVYDGELSGGIVEGPVRIARAAAGTSAGTPLVADLAGRWRGAEGDSAAWAAPAFDDRAWAEITVPERWESQGYPALDGFVWLRRTVALSAAQAARPLVFVAGAVDDLDEVFVNGVRIGGTGRMEGATPAVAGDEWQRPRAYAVPPGVLRAGANTVAVRVYDGLIDGGIVQGPVGLATPDAARAFVRSLGGTAVAPR